MTTNDVERLRGRANKQAILAGETEPDRWRGVLAETIETIDDPCRAPRPSAPRSTSSSSSFLATIIPTRRMTAAAGRRREATLLPIGVADRHA
jgi:hypothetical protein